MKSEKSKPVAKKMDPVVHFEMPAEDSKRMSAFYKKAFGWQTQQLGEEHGYYTLATTTESDKKGRPKGKAMINGGFYPKSKDKPEQHPSIVIAVDSIKRTMKKIEKAGGKVLGEPMEIPGFGMYVSFMDTEGNRVSVMEPGME
jgi:predicted enzyme related to lactoylglutathione lyase